jgi:hypothetical protein
LKFEYLREFEPEFENVSGYELGARMGSIHEKKTKCHTSFSPQSRKILHGMEKWEVFKKAFDSVFSMKN